MQQLALLSAVLTTTGLAAAGGGLPAAPASSRAVVDRTLVCKTGVGFPADDRSLYGHAGPRHGSDSPFAAVFNPSVDMYVSLQTGPGGGEKTGSLRWSRPTCARTQIRIALSPAGLSGGEATADTRYECRRAPA